MIESRPILYLSSSGDRFPLIKDTEYLQGSEVGQSFLREATACKTHNQVLEFLLKLKNKPAVANQISLYHQHNSEYPGHSLNIGFGAQKGSSHEDSIDKMIEFVKLRIQDMGTYLATLDSIAKSDIATFYLSSRGDSFEVAEDDFTSEKLDPIFQNEAAICKTHEQVLAFLTKLKDSPELLNQVSLYHRHHRRYPGHSLNIGFGIQKGRAHKDTVEQMIEYVQLRIKHKQTPHMFFDRVAKTLGPFIVKLDRAAHTPIIGTFPAALRVGIGLVQVISGLALSILFYIPAFFSENAKIIVVRSWRHFHFGIPNIAVGSFQMIPFHNKLI